MATIYNDKRQNIKEQEEVTATENEAASDFEALTLFLQLSPGEQLHIIDLIKSLSSVS